MFIVQPGEIALVAAPPDKIQILERFLEAPPNALRMDVPYRILGRARGKTRDFILYLKILAENNDVAIVLRAPTNKNVWARPPLRIKGSLALTQMGEVGPILVYRRDDLWFDARNSYDEQWVAVSTMLEPSTDNTSEAA